MKKVEIQMEVITPMFSYGSNKKSEFRITELKSLMRTTYREIYYLNKCENFNLFDMKKREAELFGSQGLKIDFQREIKACKSPISFCVKCVNRNEKNKNLLSCLGIGTKIEIILYIKDEQKVELYIHLLILSSILGGIGQKSRNGKGSFKINQIVYDKNYNKLLNKSPEEILNVILGEDWKLVLNKLDKNKLRYPFLEDVNILTIDKRNYIEDESYYIESKLKDISELNNQIYNIVNGLVSCDSNILGMAKKGKRFASPIYTTFWKSDSKLYMIVKELNYDYFIKEFEGNSKVIEIYIDELKKLALSNEKVNSKKLQEKLGGEEK